MNRFVNRLLLFTTVFVCICTAAGFLAPSWWFFELFSHFRVQYYVILAACGLIYLAKRKHREAILAIAFAIVNFSVVGNFQVETPAQATTTSRQEGTLRAVLANVNHSNKAYSKLQRFIRSANADFIILVETNEAWIKSLKPLHEHYPYNQFGAGKHGGIALLSKVPFEDAAIKTQGGVGLPSMIARFKFNGERFTLVGTHTYSPATRQRAQDRDEQLKQLAETISIQAGPVILLGDLNVTPWSPIFKDFLRNTGLRDSREGFGLQPTWPTWFPPAWIPIDHGLVSSGVVIHDRRVGPHIGSDHYPVVIDFSITAKRIRQGAKN